MKTYLSVGTNKILKDLEQPIKNGNPKPTGGLWATVHDERYPNYNPWIEYLSTKPYILFYKNPTGNPFLIPAVLITLKDTAKIFNLKNINQLEFLKKHYSTLDNWIDFEKLSKDYDCLFIDPYELSKSSSPEIRKAISTFAISSLIIFNLDSIKYYQEATVEIEPFDYEYNSEFMFYEVKVDEKKYEIGEVDDITKTFLTKLKAELNGPVDEKGLDEKYNQVLTDFAIEFLKRKGYTESPKTIKDLLIRNITRSI